MKKTIFSMKGVAILCAALSLMSCDSSNIYFKNPAKGRNPYNLIGDYDVRMPMGDSIYTDTISIHHLNKANYLITNTSGDTLYSGEIRRKKSDYFLNQKHKTKELWNICAFRIKGDSAYNFTDAMLGISSTDLVRNDYFEEVKENEYQDQDVTVTEYLINNTKSETHRAFAMELDSSYACYFKEILIKQSPKDVQDETTVQTTTMENEVPKDNQWSVYPNPFQGDLNIVQSKAETTQIRLYDQNGRVLLHVNFESKQEQLSLPELSRGTYILEFANQSGQHEMVKVIRE